MEQEEEKKFATAESAARNVISLLARYIEEVEQFPLDLSLSIGGCLIEHIDAYGDKADVNIRRLYDACGARMTKTDMKDTLDSQ